jgi:hypothetical protein
VSSCSANLRACCEPVHGWNPCDVDRRDKSVRWL